MSPEERQNKYLRQDIYYWMEHPALANALSSTYELVEKKGNSTELFGECFGSIFGDSRQIADGLEVRVTRVCPLQAALRKPTSVVPNEIATERAGIDVGDVWEGEYHSHLRTWNKVTKGWEKATPTRGVSDGTRLRQIYNEQKGMKPVMLIVSMNRTSRESELCIRDKYVSGTMLSHDHKEIYHVALKAYHISVKRYDTEREMAIGRICLAHLRFKEGVLEKAFHNGVQC